MSDDELQGPLEGLFSGGVPQPETPSPEPEHVRLAADEPAELTKLAEAQLFSVDELPEGKTEETVPEGSQEEVEAETESTGEAISADERPTVVEKPLSDSTAHVLSLLWEPRRGESVEAQVESELEEGRERILDLLLGGAALGGGVAVLAMLVGAIQRVDRLPVYIPYLIGYALILIAFLFRHIPIRLRVGVLIGVSYAVAILSILQNGVASTGPWYLLATPLLFFILVSERAGVLSGIVNVVVYVAFAAAYHLRLLPVPISIELEGSLPQTLVVMASFGLITMIVIVVQSLFSRSQSRIRRSLQEQSAALRESHAVSAQRRQELERANVTLQRQAQHFELGIQIGRVAAMGLDVGRFTEHVVRLIHECVESHYVALFTLDESRRYVQLQASAGRPMDTFLPEEQRLVVADDLLLRQCVSSGRARILLGIDQVQSLSDGETEGRFLLPDTRSAIALPMIARGEVFGVIAVQSQSPAAFRNEDMISLRAVADQVATAISSARLAEELRTRLQEMETLQRYYVREAWDQFLAAEAT
jgi:hypothetical protein